MPNVVTSNAWNQYFEEKEKEKEKERKKDEKERIKTIKT